MKGSIKKSLEEEISKLNVAFEELQISSIKDKEYRKKKFDQVYASYKELKTKIDKYNELEKDSKLNETLAGKVGEAIRWYEAKAKDWKDVNLMKLQEKVDCTMNGQEFLERFA